MAIETEVKTICVECRFCDDYCNTPSVWRCEAPANRRESLGRNFVSGKETYRLIEGSDKQAESPFPFCEEINKDGNCPHYEPKDAD